MAGNEFKKAHENKKGKACLGALPYLAAGLVFCSCADAPQDRDPPTFSVSHPMKAGQYRFGITDTVIFQFNEDVDMAGLKLETEPKTEIKSEWVGPKRLLIFGASSLYGQNHFDMGTAFQLHLADLHDKQGNHQYQAEIFLKPYMWLDMDFTNRALSGADTLFATDVTWRDGSPLSDIFINEGSLDTKSNVNTEFDWQDFKLFKLYPKDTLELTLECGKHLNMKFHLAGPFPVERFDSTFTVIDFNKSIFRDSTQNKGVARIKPFNPGFEAHDEALGNPSFPGLYVARISTELDREGFYRLTARQVMKR